MSVGAVWWRALARGARQLGARRLNVRPADEARRGQVAAESARQGAESKLGGAQEEMQKRIGFERGERLKLERRVEKLSKALRLERTRRAACALCRHTAARGAAHEQPSAAAAAAPRPRTAGGDSSGTRGVPAAGTGMASARLSFSPSPSAPLTARDARRLLGVPEGASVAAVKQAYRRAVLRAHPDKNPSKTARSQTSAASSSDPSMPCAPQCGPRARGTEAFQQVQEVIQWQQCPHPCRIIRRPSSPAHNARCSQAYAALMNLGMVAAETSNPEATQEVGSPRSAAAAVV